MSKRVAPSPDEQATTAAPSSPEWAALGFDVARAVGSVIAQVGGSPDSALNRLRELAQTTGRGLEQVAQDVIARELRFRPPTVGAGSLDLWAAEPLNQPMPRCSSSGRGAGRFGRHSR